MECFILAKENCENNYRFCRNIRLHSHFCKFADAFAAIQLVCGIWQEYYCHLDSLGVEQPGRNRCDFYCDIFTFLIMQHVRRQSDNQAVGIDYVTRLARELEMHYIYFAFIGELRFKMRIISRTT
jgi:hypothetical protein